jgi:predicted porin
MKKSLLALAVLTAVSGGAFAQSSVTLYGKVDVGVVLDSGSSKGKSLRISSGVSGGSRLGFKGVEDLGGGMKAGFQLETGFCADSNTPNGAPPPNFCTGGNNFMGRQAHVDLSGAFGSITAGRQYTLSFINLTTVDPFGTGLAGQTTNLFDASGSSAANPRVNNSVIYNTPNISGFTASLLFGAGEQQGDWRSSRTTGASAVYASGPLYVGLAFNDINGAAGILGRKNTNLGATYDFGVVKLHVIGQATKAAAPSPWVDARDVMVGISAPIGGGSLMASFNKHDDRTALDQNADQIGIGYMYALSKRTSLYTAFARIKNEHGAAFTVGNATDGGAGNKAFNLGVVHNF